MRAFSTAVSAPRRSHRDSAPPLDVVPPPLFPEGTVDLSREPDHVPITRIMSRPVISLTGETTVAEARAILRARGIHGAPVVDAGGRVLGMVSRGDLARAVEEEPGASDVPLSEVMVCFAFTLPARASLGQAAALMAYEGVHRVVVTDDTGRVVGIVSSLDIASWVGEQAGYVGLRRAI